MYYIFLILFLLHIPLAWDWLWLFYPVFLIFDSYAPGVFVAFGVDLWTAVGATLTSLVGGFGLTYWLLSKSKKFLKFAERVASIKGARFGGYVAVAASAVLVNFVAAALAAWLFRLSFHKALAVYVGSASATALSLAGAAKWLVCCIF